MDDDDVSVPNFDLGEFRDLAARFCRHLILARWQAEPRFLDERNLQRWNLEEINRETRSAAQLLRLAANDLSLLNREFLPRCGSGGVELTSPETPEGRLVAALAFLVEPGGGSPDHNEPLLELARRVSHGEDIDWNQVFDATQLTAIRDDLDRLPRSARSWSAIAKLIDECQLVVIAGCDRREAYWEGRMIGAEWNKKNRAWKLLYNLARQARQRRGLQEDTDLDFDFRGARDNLREILSPTLYKLISSRDGVFTLALPPEQIRVVQFETREYFREL